MTNYILAIMGQKGGIGKTTIAYNFYNRILRDEPSSILIDCDNDQYSSADLSFIRNDAGIEPPMPVLNMAAAELEKNIREISKNYKVIIIEFGGTMEVQEEMRLAAKIADKIIMPIQPSTLDARTIEKVEKKVLAVKDSGVPAVIIPNRVKSNEQLQFLLSASENLNYFVFSNNHLKDRLCYQNSFNDGRSIFEIKPATLSEKEGVRDFEKLYLEVFYGEEN